MVEVEVADGRGSGYKSAHHTSEIWWWSQIRRMVVMADCGGVCEKKMMSFCIFVVAGSNFTVIVWYFVVLADFTLFEFSR